MTNIKKAREAIGLSQKEVAISLGVSNPTVSDWERGIKNPSGKNLKKLATLLNCSTDYLLGVSEQTSETTRQSLREKFDMPDGIDIDTAIEAMHKNPKLKVLFSRSAKMDDADLDFMLQLIDRINKENEDGL